MGKNTKVILAAALAVMISISSFYLGRTASRKADGKQEEKAKVVESAKAAEPPEEKKAEKKEEMKVGQEGELVVETHGAKEGVEGASHPAASRKPKEKSIDEQIAEIDFSNGKSRIKGEDLIIRKHQMESRKTMEQYESETDEAKQKHALEESVKGWMQRTD